MPGIPPKKKTKVAKPPVSTYKDTEGNIKKKGGGDAGYPTAPKKMGPYMMKPGNGSQVNPGNFKKSEVMKYAAFMYNPTLTDMSGDGVTTKKDLLIARNVPGFEKGMDNKVMPNKYPRMDHK